MKFHVGFFVAVAACSFISTAKGCNIPFVPYDLIYAFLPQLEDFACVFSNNESPTSSPTDYTCAVASNLCNPVKSRPPDDIRVTSSSLGLFRFPDINEVINDPTGIILSLVQTQLPVNFDAGTFSDSCSSPNRKQTGFYVVSPTIVNAQVTIDLGNPRDDPVLLLAFPADFLPTLTFTPPSGGTVCVVDGGIIDDDSGNGSVVVKLDTSGPEFDFNTAGIDILLQLIPGLAGELISATGFTVEDFLSLANMRAAVVTIRAQDITQIQFKTDRLLFFSTAYN